MKNYYVYRVHERLWQVIHNPEDDYTKVVGSWSHPELAQEQADRLNRREEE